MLKEDILKDNQLCNSVLTNNHTPSTRSSLPSTPSSFDNSTIRSRNKLKKLRHSML